MYTYTKQTIKIFWQHAKRYGAMPYVLFLGMVAVTGLRDATPVLYRNLINFLVGFTPGQGIDVAVRLLVLIFTLNIIRVTLWRGINFLNNRFQAGVMADLTRTCYEYLHNHSVGFFNSNFVGSLVTKVKRYERSFEVLADQCLYNLGRSLMEMSIIVGILLWQYWPLGVIILGWSLTYITYTYFYARFKLPADMRRAQADTETTAQLADTITNNYNIKVFANYSGECKRFADVAEKQRQARKRSWDLGTLGEVFQGFYMIAAEFAIMYLALKWWYGGLLTLGDIVLVQAYLLRIFDQLWDTGKNIRAIYESLADANEMTEMLLVPHEVQDKPGARALTVSKGELELRNVTFAYPTYAPVLKDFSLLVHPGERIALVGQSGAGKSTIVKLLLRFSDIQGGQILIDGQNIAECRQDSLRRSIALVPQDPILFHRPLLENIRYARPQASREEVIRAAKLAHCHEFIASFPEQYDTYVGERGVKLSGGERQRVAIARAILKNAPILVLDEATSSLDSESEMFIQDALKTLMQGKTTIVIAHRLSTIMQMDRIVVIEGGKIIEEGKHKELIKARQGIYQKLWQIQAGGFA